MRRASAFAFPVRARVEPRLLICVVLCIVGAFLPAIVFLSGLPDAGNLAPVSEAAQPTERTDVTESLELVRQHRELVTSGKKPSAKQCELFGEAYYDVGRDLYRKGKRKEAGRYYCAALALCPNHGRAAIRLGDVYAAERRYKDAVEAFTRAETLDSRLEGAVKERREKLLEAVLQVADQRLKDCQVAGAKQALDFVERHLADACGDQLGERLKKIEPLLKAEALLNAAKDDFVWHRQADGYTKLRKVATEYPRTYFAQEANRLLEEHGQKVVLQGTATGYALRPHWRRKTTEHFVIYFEKSGVMARTARNAEKAYARIVETFGMADAGWQTRVTMYVFSDEEAWEEFLLENGKRPEWAAGFAMPHLDEIYLHVTDKTKDLYVDLLPHELAHVLHYRYVGKIYQPRWLKEGIAQMMEKDAVDEARDVLKEYARMDKVYSLRELVSVREAYVYLYYAESILLIDFIIKEYGLEKLKELMFAFEDTKSGEEAITKVFGISLDAFEKKWKKYLF